jgi:hypothetical protein
MTLLVIWGLILPVASEMNVCSALSVDEADPIYALCDIMKAPGKFRGSAIRIRTTLSMGALRDDSCKSNVLRIDTPMVVVDDTVSLFEVSGIDGPIDVSGNLIWRHAGANSDLIFMVSHVWSFVTKRT